ncbi:hypothetical protein [Streptomyces chartreusis]|uniref:hypothetical protein n=1 Tax=Streptomyces chartreusis TaxID=1969 RepID=UPI003408DA56
MKLDALDVADGAVSIGRRDSQGDLLIATDWAHPANAEGPGRGKQPLTWAFGLQSGRRESNPRS